MNFELSARLSARRYREGFIAVYLAFTFGPFTLHIERTRRTAYDYPQFVSDHNTAARHVLHIGKLTATAIGYRRSR